MTYEISLALIEKHKNIIGLPLGEFKVEHFIISTLKDMSDVFSLYFGNGFDNKLALLNLGILENEDLEVYVYPNKDVAIGLFADLKKYLTKRGIEI